MYSIPLWWVVIPGNPVGPTDHSSRQNASLFFYGGTSNLFFIYGSKKTLCEPKWILVSGLCRFSFYVRWPWWKKPCRDFFSGTPPLPILWFGITARACAFRRCIWVIYSHQMSFLSHYWRRFSHGMAFGKSDGGFFGSARCIPGVNNDAAALPPGRRK